MLERAKSSILPNGNFREFFLWRGGFCGFKTGIPGGPGAVRFEKFGFRIRIWIDIFGAAEEIWLTKFHGLL